MNRGVSWAPGNFPFQFRKIIPRKPKISLCWDYAVEEAQPLLVHIYRC